MRSPTLVIMAAGMGSRFGGPKQTTPVDAAGHFILHYSLFDAWRAGFRKVVFIVKPGMESEFRDALGEGVAAHFDVRFAPQALDALPEGYSVPADRQKPWGTAHAVLCAAGEIDGPFAVINADDYYGVTAFQVLYDFLAADRPESEYAMVGFRLRNTVTEHGSVARGVCEVENGLLQGVTERTKIVKRGDDAAYTEDGGETWTDLPGDTLVSMNFWGFTPLYLYELARRFPAFLENEVPKNPLKSEYFVPSVVNAQLQEGSATITVLDTPDAWHGVTYPEDLPGVKAALKALTDAGTYPENFWK
ncbi:MAG: NTP transferase domain-containing protein [Oscillospiraceae bacterium]|nr:NTP transferase domain-containing protein [Oscillospiraceae bacterium]